MAGGARPRPPPPRLVTTEKKPHKGPAWRTTRVKGSLRKETSTPNKNLTQNQREGVGGRGWKPPRPSKGFRHQLKVLNVWNQKYGTRCSKGKLLLMWCTISRSTMEVLHSARCTASLQWNAVLVVNQPLRKGLEGGVQLSGQGHVAHPTHGDVAFHEELEHGCRPVAYNPIPHPRHCPQSHQLQGGGESLCANSIGEDVFSSSIGEELFPCSKETFSLCSWQTKKNQKSIKIFQGKIRPKMWN